MKKFSAALATVFLLPCLAQSFGGGVVTNCAEADLRAAMVGGGTVSFACDGTITLASTVTNFFDTVLDGTGHQVTISGGNAVRVLYVQSGVKLMMLNLTVANGYSSNGAGLYNNGTANVTNCSFISNFALAGAGNGGAVYNAGALNIESCRFQSNCVQPYVGNECKGGAIYNIGSLIVTSSDFITNSALGGVFGSGDSYGPASGGALYNDGVAKVDSCTFAFNSSGAWLGIQAPAKGGAFCNSGTITVVGSTLVSNSVTGGRGFAGGPGANQIARGGDGYPGRAGGDGVGGAFNNAGTAVLINSTLYGNSGSGGTGGNGGNGGAGLEPPGKRSWGGNGGPGGNGGNGYGGIYSAAGSCKSTNCTIISNFSASGVGGAGGQGGYGNTAYGMPGTPGQPGSAGPGLSGAGNLLVNTLLSANLACNADAGAIMDAGHNLSSDGSCGFTNTGSLNNTDPKAGPLANNGGRTLTIALMSASPAIDTGDSAAAPTTDQRGISRPVGATPDIGSFEYGLPPILKILLSSNGVDIIASAYPGLSCRMLDGSNLSDWTLIGTNLINLEGTAVFHRSYGAEGACRFYRLVVP